MGKQKVYTARNPGCQSTNHSQCFGELWECEECGKISCEEEGCDDGYSLMCDDCWAKITGGSNETKA